MIRVVIYRNPGRVSDELLKTISKNLPVIVSENLGADGFKEHIEVLNREFGKFDLNTQDLEIIIEAREHPFGKRDIDGLYEKLEKVIKDFLSARENQLPLDIIGFIDIRLHRGSFKELKVSDDRY